MQLVNDDSGTFSNIQQQLVNLTNQGQQQQSQQQGSQQQGSVAADQAQQDGAGPSRNANNDNLRTFDQGVQANLNDHGEQEDGGRDGGGDAI